MDRRDHPLSMGDIDASQIEGTPRLHVEVLHVDYTDSASLDIDVDCLRFRVETHPHQWGLSMVRSCILYFCISVNGR